MSNKTTTSILEYAEVHRDFSMDDLFAYLHEKVGISKSSLSWYLFKLVNENRLVRTGRGMYAALSWPARACTRPETLKIL